MIAELLRRHRPLASFGLLTASMVPPTLVLWALDPRVLRGVDLWVKPLKFQVSIAVFTLCSAWFVGLLPPERRRGAVTAGAWALIGAGAFEVVYITGMALVGRASHYNADHWVFVALYLLMGVGAVTMTASQLAFAVPIARHGAPGLLRDGVVLGLVLTFVLGTASGAPLSSAQPPDGLGPLFGWHLRADLRPAHFVGMHAQQLIPAAAAMTAWLGGGRSALAAVAVAYTALWAAAMVMGLDGVTWAPPRFG